MSDTDIYKSHESAHTGAVNPSPGKGRRRRSSSRGSFDETVERRRRRKNSGLRRLLHLSRKSTNEKKFWWGLLSAVVVLLLVIAIWQFWYLEFMARKDAHIDEQYVPIRTSESAAE